MCWYAANTISYLSTKIEKKNPAVKPHWKQVINHFFPRLCIFMSP